MLPQLVNLANADFLHEFASTVALDTSFAPSKSRSAVVSALLGAAIQKACFFKPPQAVQPAKRTYQTHTEPIPPEDYSATAKLYARKAQELQCAGLVDSIIERVTDTGAMETLHAQTCAVEVMFPLAVSISAQSTNLPAKFPHLLHVGTNLYLDLLATEGYQSSVMQVHVAVLLDSALASADGSLFIDV